ncbi:Uncharacterised protein [Chlamydia abortus]|nr:Uncharacterised protein [Chlamydia abortus]
MENEFAGIYNERGRTLIYFGVFFILFGLLSACFPKSVAMWIGPESERITTKAAYWKWGRVWGGFFACFGAIILLLG